MKILEKNTSIRIQFSLRNSQNPQSPQYDILYLYTIDDTVYGTTGNELNKNYVSINIGYFPSLENSKMFNSQMHA